MRVLIVTSEWPSRDRPHDVPFLVDQVERLRGAGVEIVVFPFRGRANPLRYAAAWLRLRARHQLRSFDLVHAHFGQSGLVALPSQVPLIVTFHGSDLEGIPRADGRDTLAGRVLRAVSRFVARRADGIIVVARSLLGRLPTGLAADVIPCGIDLDRFQPIPKLEARRALGLDGDEALVLFVGDPQRPAKNFSLAREAVELMDHSLAPRLVVLHGQPGERVPLFMSACDLMIVTSHHEGSPTAVKEALACNLPVVSVPVGDVPDMISGVDGCTVVDSKNANAIARAAEATLRHAGGGATREAAARFDHSSLIPRILDVYIGATHR